MKTATKVMNLSCRVVRAEPEFVGKQGHLVAPAISAETVGARKIHLQIVRIPAGSRHVRVNAVSLGAIKTPMHSPEAHEFLSGLQPMGRMGETQEIADAVMYLEKSAFVTSEILHVDGGWSAGRG